MSKPIILCAAASVALHIVLALSLAFWEKTHPYLLHVAPARKSMVDVHLMKIKNPPVLPQADTAKKVVTTTAATDFKAGIEPKPHPKKEKTKKVAEKKPTPVKKPLVVKNELQKLPEPPPVPEKKVSPKKVQKPAVEASQVVVKTVEPVAVDSKVEDVAVQGASSEYRRIDKPHLAGRQKQPAYPYRARKLGHQGTVILDVKLDEAGKVVEVVVEKTSGHSSLDKAALSTVKRWNFQPLLENGKGIRSRVRIPVQFRLG